MDIANQILNIRKEQKLTHKVKQVAFDRGYITFIT